MILRIRPKRDANDPDILGPVVGRHRTLATAKRLQLPAELLAEEHRQITYQIGELAFATTIRIIR